MTSSFIVRLHTISSCCSRRLHKNSTIAIRSWMWSQCSWLCKWRIWIVMQCYTFSVLVCGLVSYQVFSEENKFLVTTVLLRLSHLIINIITKYWSSWWGHGLCFLIRLNSSFYYKVGLCLLNVTSVLLSSTRVWGWLYEAYAFQCTCVNNIIIYNQCL